MSVHGWRSRGYLPHCDEQGLVQHVVFGLDDAMPSSPPSHLDPAGRSAWADKVFDIGHGSRLLAKRSYAEIVENALLHGDGERYALAAWCIMPTHVHVVLEQFEQPTLAAIIHGWKSWTSHQINELESRTGTLWRREYFDRFMRSAEQFDWTVKNYVEANPVAAKLARTPEDWEFSSARWRRG